ncbi:hypothetical protein TIFTF001_018902, partial [Ficus carica]
MPPNTPSPTRLDDEPLPCRCQRWTKPQPRRCHPWPDPGPPATQA